MFTMSNNDKNEAQSADIIEEVIPGKNKDYINKPTFQNNDSSLKHSSQSVDKTIEESKKSMSRSLDEAKTQFASYVQALTDAQVQTAQATREIAENYREYQKQSINSFQSIFIPYFENIYNQFLYNQEFSRRIPEMYSRIATNYAENTIAFSRIFNDALISNIDYFRNAVNKAKEQSKYLIEIGKSNTSALSVPQGRISKIEVDDGRNSDETTTNVKATFSCEKCGQTFNLRQELKEHSSLTH